MNAKISCSVGPRIAWTFSLGHHLTSKPGLWCPLLKTYEMRQAGVCSHTLAQGLSLFSHPVLSNSLQPHGLQHTKPPCPSPSPEVCPSSCPLHWWCHSAISSSDALFFCPQSFPALGTFPMSWLFTSGDQTTGPSASALVLPMSIEGWFPLRLTGLISLLSKGLSGIFSTTVESISSLAFFGLEV